MPVPVARERLSKRCLRDGESVDELARDIEKLLDQASPGLPNEVKDSELRFHLINSLPESLAATQSSTKGWLCRNNHQGQRTSIDTVYKRTEGSECVNQVQSKDDARLQKLEETIQTISEQLTALNTRKPNSGVTQCFTCGKPGHTFRNCRARAQQIECFNCGGRGHIARNCWSQGNAKGGTSTHRARECPPVLRSTCSTEYVPTLANIHTTPTVAHVKGKINSHTTLILLDSGASCSVVAHKYIPTKHV